jgi:hypothetical protein
MKIAGRGNVHFRDGTGLVIASRCSINWRLEKTRMLRHFYYWCERGDWNPHALRRQMLS